jgi:hypothetical protein
MDAHDEGALGEAGDDADDISPDEQASADDPMLTQLDKTVADSFPASDPPAVP